MRSGRLREIVRFERRTKVAERFGTREEWTTLFTRRADVRTPSGREAIVADQRRAELSHVVVVRAPLPVPDDGQAVNTQDRIIHRGHELGITAILPTDTHRRELTLYATEAPADGGI